MKADLLAQEFTPRAVGGARAGAGGLLLRPADALELVDRAAEEGVPIVRIDLADVAPGTNEPPADFSAAVAQGHGCWHEAEAYIKGRVDRHPLFRFTLGDDPIEAV